MQRETLQFEIIAFMCISRIPVKVTKWLLFTLVGLKYSSPQTPKSLVQIGAVCTRLLGFFLRFSSSFVRARYRRQS